MGITRISQLLPGEKKQHFAPKLITFPSLFHTRTPLLFYFPISQGGETHTDARSNRGE